MGERREPRRQFVQSVKAAVALIEQAYPVDE